MRSPLFAKLCSRIQPLGTPLRLSSSRRRTTTGLTFIAFAAVVACAEAPNVAEVWVTTGDQAKLLAREPDTPISAVATDTVSGVAYIDVDTSTVYQEIVGFGASITDASAWLIQTKLSSPQRDSLLRDLFGRNPGIGLSFTRLTIGA